MNAWVLRVYNKITRKCPGKVQVFKDFLKFRQGSINKGHPIFEQDMYLGSSAKMGSPL